MESTEILKLTVQEDGVAIVQIHRPEARNALNLELRQQLSEAFQYLSKLDAVKAIVLTGGEKVLLREQTLKISPLLLQPKCIYAILNSTGKVLLTVRNRLLRL